MVLTICNADFAIEWVRPMPPNFKMIGPVLPEPAKPLPADVEVRLLACKQALPLHVPLYDRQDR